MDKTIRNNFNFQRSVGYASLVDLVHYASLRGRGRVAKATMFGN